MRAVKCKRLRRLARNFSKGMPERELLAQKHPISVTLPNGERVTTVRWSAFNNPKTTRGIYLGLKRGHLEAI